MRILQICSAREIGGGEKHLIDLAASLARRDHQVFAAVPSGSPLIGELGFLPKRNVMKLPLNGSLNVLGVPKLVRFIRSNKVDVIHAHAARDYPLAALAARLSGGTRYVLTRHVLFPMSRIHKLLLRRVGRFIAVSRAVHEALAKQDIVDPNRIVTIYNGIDVDRFSANDPAASRQGRFTVGMAGHLSSIKGQDIFIRAAEIVAAKVSDVEFVIAGEDKSRDGINRRSIEDLIVTLGLGSRVRISGWVDDIAEFYGGLDLFVSPSRSEPFGLAIVEAMAAGVPVIASASEGAREIIEDGVTGRLVPIEDVQTLADSIVALIDDSKERDHLRKNARSLVIDKFSLQKMADATISVYSELLETEDTRNSKRRL